MKGMTITIGAVAALTITGMADAGIIFYTDETLFNQALADAGKFFKGIEDFEQLTNPIGANLDDPLNINNLQGAFNPGDFIDNLTFQSNTNGTPLFNDPGVSGLNPRGLHGLALFGAGNAGFVNVSLITAFDVDSLDILSGPPAGGNHSALAMHVVVKAFVLSPVDVRVFDKNERQIGLITMSSNLAGQFLGILATDGETIGRVNIWEISGNFLQGVYDVQTYVIPTPSAWALLCVAGLFGVRRRRR